MSLLDLPHIGFVMAAYVMAAAVIGGLVGAVLIDHRAQRRALAAYEAQAARRPATGRRPA